PARGGRALDPGGDGARVGHVGDHIARRMAFGGGVGKGGFIAAEDGHRGARLGERRRDGAADAAAAAGDDGVMPVERDHRRRSPSRLALESEITLNLKLLGFKYQKTLRDNYFKLKVSWTACGIAPHGGAHEGS